MDVYPIVFEPLYKQKIWGGRKLETLLGKALPPGERIGESWEVADLESEQSKVTSGPAKGKTLEDLLQEWGPKLTGRAPLCNGRFPLLVKFLDVSESLSIQVHPDDAAAQRLGPPAQAKNEAWYVIEAPPGGYIYRGVLQGVTESDLRTSVSRGDIESLLLRVPVGKGKCYYLPGGTIHAIGPGLTLAEVQTPSDTTYRLFDWNRRDPSTGGPRELHVEQALACTSYAPPPARMEHPEHLASVWTSITSLVRTPWFVIERVRMAAGVELLIPHQEMVIWIVLEGRGSILHEGLSLPTLFAKGDTVVIPAGLRKGRVQTGEPCMWLEVTVPIASSLAGFSRPDRSWLAQSGGERDQYVPLRVPPKSGKRRP